MHTSRLIRDPPEWSATLTTYDVVISGSCAQVLRAKHQESQPLFVLNTTKVYLEIQLLSLASTMDY